MVCPFVVSKTINQSVLCKIITAIDSTIFTLTEIPIHNNVEFVRNYKSLHSKTIIIISILFFGCVNTEGDLEIEGRVIDEFTKATLPWRNIIVQGIKKSDENILTLDVGQFSTDSSGRFKYKLKKIRDVRYYNISFVGDSNYAFKNKELSLYDLEQNSKYLSFTLNKLADLFIIVNRKSKKPEHDTLSLAWDSNDVFFWSLFPYKIYNSDKSNSYTVASGGELRWYGGNVSSIVKTRVFAEKKTRIYWDLIRYGRRSEFTDTITCKRDFINKIYFSY